MGTLKKIYGNYSLDYLIFFLNLKQLKLYIMISYLKIIFIKYSQQRQSKWNHPTVACVSLSVVIIFIQHVNFKIEINRIEVPSGVTKVKRCTNKYHCYNGYLHLPANYNNFDILSNTMNPLLKLFHFRSCLYTLKMNHHQSVQ